MRKRTLLMVGWGLSGAVVAAGAEPYRDVVRIGDRHYLRTEQFPYALEAGATGSAAVALHSDRAAYAAIYDDQGASILLRQFSRWGEPLHAHVSAERELPDLQCYAAAYAQRTWLLWRRMDKSIWTRVFDPAGQALTPALLVRSAEDLFGWFPCNLTAGAELTAAVLMEVRDGPLAQRDLHVALYRPDGTPRTELFPVVATPENEYGGWVAVLSDQQLVMGYTVGYPTAGPSRVYLRHVYADKSVGPAVRITGTTSDGGYVKLLADRTLLVYYRLLPGGSGAYVRRFSTDLLPLGEPVAVDAELSKIEGYISVADDGSFALVGRLGYSAIAARLYDTEWRPRTDRFDPTSPVGPPIRDFGGPTVPAAYDGHTLVVAWEGHGGPWYRTSFLTVLTAFQPADMNVDNVVNNFDIDPFVLALTNPDEYKKRFPGVPFEYIGDCNFDGQFNNFDIDPFVKLLTP